MLNKLNRPGVENFICGRIIASIGALRAGVSNDKTWTGLWC